MLQAVRSAPKPVRAMADDDGLVWTANVSCVNNTLQPYGAGLALSPAGRWVPRFFASYEAPLNFLQTQEYCHSRNAYVAYVADPVENELAREACGRGWYLRPSRDLARCS